MQTGPESFIPPADIGGSECDVNTPLSSSPNQLNVKVAFSAYRDPKQVGMSSLLVPAYGTKAALSADKKLVVSLVIRDSATRLSQRIVTIGYYRDGLFFAIQVTQEWLTPGAVPNSGFSGTNPNKTPLTDDQLTAFALQLLSLGLESPYTS